MTKISLIIIIIFNSSIIAQERIFIREYTYNASESDSKNSSRQKAIEQVKILLLEEIGIYVESWVQLETVEKNKRIEDFFKEEVKTITAGITETEIIEEKWDGYKYYVKAQITIDTNDVIRKINQAIEARINSKEIERLRELLTVSESEVAENQEEIANLTISLNEQQKQIRRKEQELSILKTQLEEAKRELRKIEVEKKNVKSEIDRIRMVIESKTKLAIENVELGMTEEEVIRVAGRYRAIKTCSRPYNNRALNYGQVWIIIEGKVVSCIVSITGYVDCQSCGYLRVVKREDIIK